MWGQQVVSHRFPHPAGLTPGVSFIIAAEGGGQHCLHVPDVTGISLLLSCLGCQPLCTSPFSPHEEPSRLFCW